MRFSRKPKFSIGDIVDLRPYEHFKEHVAIPQWYWNKMNSTNPHKINIIIPGQHTVEGKDEMIEDIYYCLDDDGYSYCEHFLAGHIELLPDDLFEV